MISPEELQNRFAYHAPTGGKVAKHASIRNDCHALAQKIVASVPPGREQAQAITKLEEVMVWANAGIARNPEVVTPAAEEPAAIDYRASFEQERKDNVDLRNRLAEANAQIDQLRATTGV